MATVRCTFCLHGIYPGHFGTRLALLRATVQTNKHQWKKNLCLGRRSIEITQNKITQE